MTQSCAGPTVTGLVLVIVACLPVPCTDVMRGEGKIRRP
jgi:hypothetical protein